MCSSYSITGFRFWFLDCPAHLVCNDTLLTSKWLEPAVVALPFPGPVESFPFRLANSEAARQETRETQSCPFILDNGMTPSFRENPHNIFSLCNDFCRNQGETLWALICCKIFLAYFTHARWVTHDVWSLTAQCAKGFCSTLVRAGLTFNGPIWVKETANKRFSSGVASYNCQHVQEPLSYQMPAAGSPRARTRGLRWFISKDLGFCMVILSNCHKLQMTPFCGFDASVRNRLLVV